MILLFVGLLLQQSSAALEPKYKHEVLDGIYGLSMRYLLHEREIHVECGKPLTNITLVATPPPMNLATNATVNATTNTTTNYTSKYDSTKEVRKAHKSKDGIRTFL